MSDNPTPRPHHCERCGKLHRRCLAHNRQGGPCGHQPANGSDVCRLHGGSSPQAKAKAHLRLVEGQARRFVDLQGAAPVEDPIAALAQLGGEALALKDALATTVADLEQVRYQGRVGEQVRGEIQALLNAMGQAERLLVALAKLDLDERRVRLDESKAALVAGVIERVLQAAGLDPSRIEVRRLVAAELEAVAQ